MSLIDPEAKKRAAEKARERSRLNSARLYAARKKLKTAAITKNEKLIIGQVLQDNPSPSGPQMTALAAVLQRKPATIRRTIQQAREEFQRNAKEYVALHMKAARSDDPDVSRKAAQWAIEKMSTRDSKGHIERIIDVDEGADNRPVVQIGIALGGIPHQPRRAAALDAELDEVDDAE